MKRTLITFLLFAFTTPAFALVSGTVLDQDGEPLVGAEVYTTNADGSVRAGASTGLNGEFSIDKISNDDEVIISYLGYTSQQLPASELQDKTITLEEDDNVIPDVDITDKKPKHQLQTKDVHTNPKDHIDDKHAQQTYVPDDDDADDNTYDDMGADEQRLQELKTNAEAAHENETAWKNKLIGAAGIGITGIGGKMIGEALSEQDADEDIERQMNAYINTFRCEYGNYPAVAGGKTNIELPGGNELFNLYAQYATLSNDLKIRKEALGIKPGIESEIVWDKAETGLYDDVGTGIVAGSYASVARALLLGGADAAAWAAQKDATAEKLKTGVIVAGVGAVGSALANAAVNNPNKKRTDKIEPLHELADNINSIPPHYAPCPDNATGTAPQCTCNNPNYYYNDKEERCDPCNGGREMVDGQCKCPTAKPYYDNDKNECFTRAPQCTPQCDLNADNRLRTTTDGCACYCDPASGYTLEDGRCVCKHEVFSDGTCGIKQTEQIVNDRGTTRLIKSDTQGLSNESLFYPIGSTLLRDEAKAEIDNFINMLKEDHYSDCIFYIKGYADPYGAKPKKNEEISEARAAAVEEYFREKIDPELLSKSEPEPIKSYGFGQGGCTCQKDHLDGVCYGLEEGKYPLETYYEYKPCRRVDLEMTCIQTITEEIPSEE